MKDATIKQIQQRITLLRSQHNNVHGSQEQQWIQDHLNDDHLQTIVMHLSIIAFHTLSALEDGEKTGIELANQLQVTRGGVTRAAKKLLSYDLVAATQHPDDRKKIYYSLTNSGKTLARVHDQMHAEIRNKLVDRLSAAYSDQELQIVAKFLDDLYEFEQQLK